MDPQTYGRVGSMSAVVRQPETPDERRKALQALHACPTHSIQVKHQVCCWCPHWCPHCDGLQGASWSRPWPQHSAQWRYAASSILHSGAWRTDGSAARLPTADGVRRCVLLRLHQRVQLWRHIVAGPASRRQCHDGLATLSPRPFQATPGWLLIALLGTVHCTALLLASKYHQ